MHWLVSASFKYVLSVNKPVLSEPSAGYCSMAYTTEGEYPVYSGGIGAVLEGGYSLGVGQREYVLNLRVKYETDRALSSHIINSVGLRLSYEFNMLRKMEE